MIAPILKTAFRKDQARSQAETLYAALAEQARAPEFYRFAGVPDTPEGRFDLLSVHVAIALDRLREDGAPADKLVRRLQEVFFESLDAALRELGVGDLSVGRKIRALAEAFYGRYGAYRAGLAEDSDTLAAAIARNVLSTDVVDDARPLAFYARAARAALACAPTEELASAVNDLRALSNKIFAEIAS